MRGKVVVIVGHHGTGQELLCVLKEHGFSDDKIILIGEALQNGGVSAQDAILALQEAVNLSRKPSKELMENLKQSIAIMETKHYEIVWQKRPRTQKKGVDENAYKYHKFNKGKL